MTEVKKERKILGAKFVKLDIVGEIFVGKLVGREAMRINGNDTYRYTLTSEGGKFAMIGTRQLDDALADAEIGIDVEITYKELVSTGNGFELKVYEVAQIV